MSDSAGNKSSYVPSDHKPKIIKPDAEAKGFSPVAIIIIAVLAVLVVGGILLAIVLTPASSNAMNEANQSVNKFVNAAKAGDVNGMMSLVKPGTLTQQDLQTLVTNDKDFLSKFTDSEADTYTAKNSSEQGSLGGKLNYNGAPYSRYQATVQKVNGQWLISSIQLDRPSQ